METNKTKIFVDGFYSNDVPDSAPPFVLGRGSLHIDKLIKFLEDNRQYAVDGYIQYSILRSKNAGNRYVILDTYSYEKKQEEVHTQPHPEIAQDMSGDIDIDKIPF